MYKLFILAPNEQWILDRWYVEWRAFHPAVTVDNPAEADILWLFAEWDWERIPLQLLRSKTLCVMIQHITPWKFHEAEQMAFQKRDAFVDIYHVPCQKTAEFVRTLTEKRIEIIPPWINQHLWRPLGDKPGLRAKYSLPESAFLVGSFQRDTEGRDLITPKLEKGPDIFCDAVAELRTGHPDLHVVLAGWRRQYVIKRLQDAGIPYSYFELPEHEVVNELYNLLDLYVVSSRIEGGPQAVLEAALTECPIISTDVGLAADYLSPGSIFTPGNVLAAQPDVPFARAAVRRLEMPAGFKAYNDLFESLKS